MTAKHITTIKITENQVRYSTTILVSLVLTLLPMLGLADEYSHGNQALELFDGQGYKNSPMWVQVWVMFMGLCFICGLAFVKNHVIARWVVGGMLAGVVFSALTIFVLGLPALSGYIALVHVVFWSPGLFLLLKHRPFLESKSVYSIWTGVITFVILFSFVFDIRDAAIYLRHLL